ncbi:MAG: nucleotidyltransferase domain-containing protein [Bacteroidales bacterium]|nr:nucleotidyltransferase domain-containing protein [Bacteroidales bacterium]MBS3775410.1 nucleotidyltransferase domain-containing protein [Bacteroidales bacterium]
MENRHRIDDLREREKELNCLYRIMQILKDEEKDIDDILKEVVDEIPYGWRFSGICMVKLIYQDRQFTTPHFYETKWYQSAEIVVDEKVMGDIRVYYAENVTEGPESLFLPEEYQLLKNIATQVSLFIFNRRLRYTLNYLSKESSYSEKKELLPHDSDYHWKWRDMMAHVIAQRADFKRFGIKAIYIIGSTQEGTAGAGSDLDLLIHADADERQRELIKAWIDGWSKCLAEVNYERTGYQVKDLIDLHLVTTRELKDKKDSFAAMVGRHENAAKLIREEE